MMLERVLENVQLLWIGVWPELQTDSVLQGGEGGS